MKPGDRVRVPFGTRTLDATVLYIAANGTVHVHAALGDGPDTVYMHTFYRPEDIERHPV